MDTGQLLVMLAQVMPTDPNTPWMWLSGILATGIVAIFTLYTKKILAGETEWKTTAKEATETFPLMQQTLDKSVDTLRIQQTLIEKLNADISSLKDTVIRVERHLEDVRAAIATPPPPSRRRPGSAT